jgi:hypothetical protein
MSANDSGGPATVLDLLQRSRREPPLIRRATLLEAIDAADATNDLDLGYRIRSEFVRNCHNASDSLAMVANYGWMLARHDEDPSRFSISLWEYKWVVQAAMEYSGVSRDKLHELVEDLATRFEAQGASRGPAAVARCELAAITGDIDGLAHGYETWKSTPRGGRLNDCPTCDLTSEIYFLRRLGRHVDSIAVAEPVISGGRTCATEPHHAYAGMLDSARAVGDDELAAMCSQKGTELIRNDPDFTDAFGHHMRHHAIRRDFDAGLAMLRRTSTIAIGSEANLLAYHRGARLVVALADHHQVGDLAELHQFVDGNAEALAAKFDARNGNTSVTDTLRADDAELALG